MRKTNYTSAQKKMIKASRFERNSASTRIAIIRLGGDTWLPTSRNIMVMPLQDIPDATLVLISGKCFDHVQSVGSQLATVTGPITSVRMTIIELSRDAKMASRRPYGGRN